MNAGDDYDIRKKLARVERDRDALASRCKHMEEYLRFYVLGHSTDDKPCRCGICEYVRTLAPPPPAPEATP